MKPNMEKLEHFLQLGGIKKDILFLALSGIAIVCSLLDLSPFPFDMAWIAIILCGVPIILEAIIGLVTAFDIKADVLVSMALIASVFIGEDFAPGEVAFIMRDHPGSVLPLRSSIGDPHRHHGGHRQCDKAWLSGPGGRRHGTPV